MATITLTIPDAVLSRVIAGLSPDDPTGPAAKQVIINMIKMKVVRNEKLIRDEEALLLEAADVDVT